MDLVHLFAGQHGHRPGRGRRLAERRILQMFVVVGKRLVVVVDGRKIRVCEQVGQYLQLAALTRFELACRRARPRSEEHTSELQSLMRTSYAVFRLKQKMIKDLS